jgi:hypothetical protein
VRTKAISVKKVRGEVNPADLFTKHLPSKDKVHQLLALFGCEYRSGRAASAPLLRPDGSDGRQGGQPTGDDPLPTFSLEGELHDESMLPHLYSNDEIERMFPQIQAAPVQPNAEDWIPSADRDHDSREHGGAQAGRDLGARGHGGAAVTTDRRKVVRRNIGKRGEKVSEICRPDDSMKIDLDQSIGSTKAS